MSKQSASFHRDMMLRAIRLSRRGEGRVEPNPMVGCVIVRQGRIIGEGYHKRFGGPHAEVEGLRVCGEDPRGATVYVSLEPCSHYGKTPPCALALVDARVKHVYFAVADPGAESGGGAATLRQAGVRVEAGLCADEAIEVLAPFLTGSHLGRPYVIGKWAQSVDGKIATHTGDSQWISGERSRRQVHQLRARVDAILVGSGTALADDPLLTARDVRVRRVALRVLMDGGLRVRENSQLVTTAREVPVLLCTSRDAAGSPKADRLRRRGVEVIPCRTRANRVSPADVLAKLHDRGTTNVLIEGGGEVLTSFHDVRLLDEVRIFVSPRLIGGAAAPGPLAGRGPARMADVRDPARVEIRNLPPDLLYQMRLNPVPTTRARAKTRDS